MLSEIGLNFKGVSPFTVAGEIVAALSIFLLGYGSLLAGWVMR